MGESSSEERSQTTWESLVRTLQDARWVAQGVQPGDDGEPVQLALWWKDGIVTEYGSTSPIHHRGFGCGRT